MIDLGRFDESQVRYSPDNRLDRRARVALAITLRQRHGVSGARALEMVGEVQAKAQAALDERVTAAGGRAWTPTTDERTWAEWASAATHGPAGLAPR